MKRSSEELEELSEKLANIGLKHDEAEECLYHDAYKGLRGADSAVNSAIIVLNDIRLAEGEGVDAQNRLELVKASMEELRRAKKATEESIGEVLAALDEMDKAAADFIEGL